MQIQDRLRMIIKMNNLNASSFADRVGVQRSSVSHILTGRNKPSLDFIQKTLKEFPRVNGDWLVTGRANTNTTEKSNSSIEDDVKTEKNEVSKPKLDEDKSVVEVKKIAKIIVYYTDGTYDETVKS